MSDAIGVELAQLAREIWDWQRETFGDGCTVHGAVAKIRDECGEVLTADARMVAMSVRAAAEGVVAIAGGEVLKGAALVGLSGKAGDMATQGAARREELGDVFFMLVQLDGCTFDEWRRLPSFCDDVAYRHERDSVARLPLAQALGRLEAFAAGAVLAHERVQELRDMWGGGSAERPLRSIWAESIECAVSAWGSACHANDDLPHMPAAIRAKLEENRSRTWGKPAADGTISHVKGGE